MGTQRTWLTRIWAVCIALMLIGILLRFVNLDRKVYWHDEAYTSMEITAHTRSELVAEKFTGGEVAPEELMPYQQMDPSRGLGQMITSVGAEDPQHPPLYYILCRFWVQLWGNSSVTTVRTLSAILSLLIFPSVYWFCLELFESPLVGWIAIALLAISPLQFVYAQEAREYSFWTAVILLSSTFLLRAIKASNWLNWGLYSLSLIVSFYLSFFSSLIVVGHGVYILFIDGVYTLSLAGFRLGKRTTAYLISVTVAIIAFLPWVYFLFKNLEVFRASTGWIKSSLPALMLTRMWIINLTRPFFDFNINPLTNENIWVYLAVAPIIILEIYSIYFVCQRAPKRIWLFLLTFIGATLLGLLLPDLFRGGQRSTVTRYLIPTLVGIQLCTAYLLANQLSSKNSPRRQLGKFLAGLLAILGLSSCIFSSQADTWWNKVISTYNPEIARIVNASDRPIIISDGFGSNPANILSLSYLLEPKVRMLLLPEINVSIRNKTFEIPKVSESYRDIFAFNLPEAFLNPFETQYEGKFVKEVGELWRFKK